MNTEKRKINNFFKDTSIYLFSTILSSAIPFILLPIMTRFLTQAEYGQVGMFQSIVMALSSVVGVSVHGAANRKFFDSDISKDTLSKFVGACLQILIITSTLIMTILIIFNKDISRALNVPDHWIVFALIIGGVSFVSQIRLGQWQVRNKVKKFGLFQVSNSVLNMCLSLLFVIILLQGAEGRVVAQVIVAVILGTWSLYLLYKDQLVTLICFRKDLLKEALSFGIPLVPHVVAGFLILTLDRFVINRELGLESLGVYMVAVQLSSIFKVVFQSFNKAYSPWLFDKLSSKDKDIKRKIVKFTYVYFLFLLVIATITFVISPLTVVFIAGESYRDAGNIVGILCLGNIFNGMYLMVTNYVFYSKKTGKLSLVTIISGGVNILLLLLLIKPFGLVGAGIAYAASNLTMFLFTWFLAHKSYEMPWLLFSTQK